MDLGGWICATAFGAVVLAFGVIIAVHNVRILWVKRRYRALSETDRRHVLDLIARSADEEHSCTLHRFGPDSNSSCIESRLGGEPYAEAGDTWPLTDAKPAPFLIQLRLSDPLLGPTWQGRLIVVFLMHDVESTVRSYAAPSAEKFVRLPEAMPRGSSLTLTPLRLPSIREADFNRFEARIVDPFWPEFLLNRVDGLRDELGSNPKGLLAQILMPGTYGENLDESGVVVEAGSPSLIQNEHDAACRVCNKPMRFLFQCGDVVPGVRIGDAGIVTVYGCESHPEVCSGFNDTH